MKKLTISEIATLTSLLIILFGLQACNQKSVKQYELETTDANQAELAKLKVTSLSGTQFVYIPYTKLKASGVMVKDYSVLRVLQNKAVLPVQHIDRNGDTTKDGVLVELNDFSASEVNLTLSLDSSLAIPSVEKKTQAEISVKRNGTWVEHPNVENKQAYIGGDFVNVQEVSPPDFYTDHSNWIRYEGPGIESNLVGYRIYLDWRNGIDIFGKKISTPILQQVGLDGYQSYHEMAPWGMDILKVGSSLGAGGFGFWDGEKLHLPNDVESRHAQVVENGDLYSAFSIEYHNWALPNLTTTLSAQFSMQANSRLVQTQLSLSKNISNLVIGVVKHEGTQLLTGNLQTENGEFGYLASWGEQSLSGDHLGMAVIIPVSQYQQILELNHSYAALMDTSKNTLTYYFLAAWEGEHNNGIASIEAFEAYLKEQANRLNEKPKVEVLAR